MGMASFVMMEQHFHDIVRSVDPQALVASPAPVDASWLDTYLAAGGSRDVDALAIHGYLSTETPEDFTAQKTTPMKALAVKYSMTTKPLWDTEGSWGCPTCLTDAQAQVAFVGRYYLLHWSDGFKRFYWYSWDDNGNGPAGVGWGSLFNPATHTALPAAAAYQQVYNWMVGSKLNSPCAASTGIWTCPMTLASGSPAQAMWSTSGTQVITPPALFTQFRDLAGGTTAINGGTVSLGASPILLN
jgi:hypothetical protein